ADVFFTSNARRLVTGDPLDLPAAWTILRGQEGRPEAYGFGRGLGMTIRAVTAAAEQDTAREEHAANFASLLERYGRGPVRLAEAGDALYERHLMFGSLIEPAEAGLRQRYEAVARSVRDILAQRWHLTEQTYARDNPKRIYYLSMEFLIGRS